MDTERVNRKVTCKETSLNAHRNTSKGDKRWKLLEATIKRHQSNPDALIEILHKAQELFGHCSPELLTHVSKSLSLPLSHVYGVVTFYHFFSLIPKGLHSCTVCLGTACYVKDAAQLLAVVEQSLDIRPSETSADGMLSLSTARCLGACGIAPVVVVDDVVEGYQTADAVMQRIEACK